MRSTRAAVLSPDPLQLRRTAQHLEQRTFVEPEQVEQAVGISMAEVRQRPLDLAGRELNLGADLRVEGVLARGELRVDREMTLHLCDDPGRQRALLDHVEQAFEAFLGVRREARVADRLLEIGRK